MSSDFNMLLRSSNILKSLLCALIFWCLVFPTGMIFSVNIKMILTALVLIFGYPLWKKFSVTSGLFALFVLFIFLWSVLGMLNGYPLFSVLLEAKLFVATALIVYLCFSALRLYIISVENFFRLFVFGVCLYALFKLIIVLLLLFHIFSINWFVGKSWGIFHQLVVTMPIYGDLYRVSTTNDILLPLALLLLLINAVRFRMLLRVVMVTLITFAVYLSFSRYIWCFYLLVLSICFVVSAWRIRLFYILGSVCFVLFLYMLYKFGSSALFYQFVGKRFVGVSVYHSDVVRFSQMKMLTGFWLSRLFFGHGIGSYVYGYVRDKHLPFSYELQWLSFLSKFGIVGLSILLSFILAPAIVLFVRVRTMLSMLVMVILFAYLSAGFVNPLLFNTAFAVGYVIILFSASARFYAF